MKWLILSALPAWLLAMGDCNHPQEKQPVYEGRLEITGICYNYTIAFTGNLPDSSLYVDKWTDEVTGKQYDQVFRLGNPCDFPPELKQGDTFRFRLDTTKGKECAVCLAYYPTPAKALSIRVLK